MCTAMNGCFKADVELIPIPMPKLTEKANGAMPTVMLVP